MAVFQRVIGTGEYGWVVWDGWVRRAQINWRCLVRVVEFDDVPERGLRAEVLRAADLAPRGAGEFCSMALANYYPYSYTFCLDVS